MKKQTLHNLKHLSQKRKDLRNSATAAEKSLWHELRQSKLSEKKFRRQHSIGNFIVDFYCPEERLIIELDGEIHDDEKIKAYDNKRQKKLEKLNFRVLRFTNEAIADDLGKVLEEIKRSFT